MNRRRFGECWALHIDAPQCCCTDINGRILFKGKALGNGTRCSLWSKAMKSSNGAILHFDDSPVSGMFRYTKDSEKL
jgi:hypothetical protein